MYFGIRQNIWQIPKHHKLENYNWKIQQQLNFIVSERNMLGIFSSLDMYLWPDKQIKNCFKYPRKIVKLNSGDDYDNARWILFNWLGAEQLDEMYYGQMDWFIKM
jgi:hypothetical protein